MQSSEFRVQSEGIEEEEEEEGEEKRRSLCWHCVPLCMGQGVGFFARAGPGTDWQNAELAQVIFGLPHPKALGCRWASDFDGLWCGRSRGGERDFFSRHWPPLAAIHHQCPPAYGQRPSGKGQAKWGLQGGSSRQKHLWRV